METYIGMDVSLQQAQMCVVDGEGKIVMERGVASEARAISGWLGKHGTGWEIRRIVFETGQLSPALYHGLKAAGFPVVCVDARHAHGMLKAQRVKTDRNDARGLAHMARTGWYREVHVKSESGHALRELVAGRKQLVEARLMLEQHMRGTLKTFGLKLGAATTATFAARIEQLVEDCDELVRVTMAALLAARAGMLEQEKALDRRCKALATKDEVCRHLMTIPGVGEITALAFKAEIDDPARFRRSRDVGAHVGLTPRKYASGEVDRNGGISKCGNGALRTLLFEASVVMLSCSKKWSRLKAWGVKLAMRSSFRVACAAVARKLAIIMHRMWVDGTDFVFGREPSPKAV